MELLKCPYCGGRSLEVRSVNYNIPHLGKALLVSIRCGHCGFSRAEVVPLEVKDPIRIILKVSLREDYNVKIVKSPMAKLKVPELGVEISPGPLAQTYITNLEGIVKRLRDIGEIFLSLMEGESGRLKALEEYMRKVRKLEEGEPFTLIIEDPVGISKVLGGEGKVKVEKMDKC
ncbi:MAG: hypothetical protein B6U69_01505 [Thermofilum sp. ex4484_15]|nr:MAG: hypothetical protein B6U69_01505 [Thermofilum sp. ex4484_15]